MMIVEGMLPMLVGSIVVLFGAVALSRTLASLLYVTATDPATFVAVPLALMTQGLLAVSIPARRATRVDPRVALSADLTRGSQRCGRPRILTRCLPSII